MPSEQERLVAAYFHANRSASKKKPSPGVAKIVQAMLERNATTPDEWEKRLTANFAEHVAKLNDGDLLLAIRGVDFDNPDYEILLAEVRRRDLDL